MYSFERCWAHFTTLKVVALYKGRKQIRYYLKKAGYSHTGYTKNRHGLREEI